MTLTSRDHYETAYVVLAHFLVIAQRAPVIFSSVRLVRSSHICSPVLCGPQQADFLNVNLFVLLLALSTRC